MFSKYWENKGQSWTKNYFSYFMSSCTNRIAVFNNLFALIYSQPRNKQNRARDLLLFKYFLNNLLLTIFMKNTLLCLIVGGQIANFGKENPARSFNY